MEDVETFVVEDDDVDTDGVELTKTMQAIIALGVKIDALARAINKHNERSLSKIVSWFKREE